MELPDLDLTEYQAFQKLNSLRTDKAQGPDNVSRIAEQVAKPVLQCIEFKKKSLEEGILPLECGSQQPCHQLQKR